MGDHYNHAFPEVQLNKTGKVIHNIDEDYYYAFMQVLGSTKAHMFNMFAMKSEILDEYCEWLFPILFELQKRVDPKQYDSFNARYPGRIGEILLDVWLIARGHSYAELPVVNIEPVNWLNKGMTFLRAKYAGHKYTKSF